jgi:glycosyltransferase involved in cell wall biosynthesis
MAPQKLRVAFVDYILDPEKPGRSGVSDVVWDMASELLNQGHEVHIIASYHTSVFPDSRVVVHQFPTPPIGYRNVIGHFWILKRAAAIARQLRPDIVHAPVYLSTAVFATLRVPAPLVLTVPGNAYHRVRYGHDYEWYYMQILKWAARVSARRCARVIAVSREMKDWWEWTGSAPDRTPFIPYGVNTNRFKLVSLPRERLGLAEQKLLLLYVGRFSKEKGLLDLIDALAAIRDQLAPEDVQVMLVGKGPQLREIQQRIEQHDLRQIVQLKPWVAQEELSTWYSAADALLVPSHTEGFARIIPEAMICGTPIIGSKITGTEDHVKEGVNGFLFPAGDSKALAAILAKAIQSAQVLRDMRPAVMDYAQTHLAWEAIVARILDEVYLPIAQAGPRSPEFIAAPSTQGLSE